MRSTRFSSAPAILTLGCGGMDFAKLVDLLDSEALFFPRADMLDDPLEGSYSEANVRLRSEVYGKELSALTAQIGPLMREMRRFTVISCWHLSAYEPAAMWERYATQGYAVAVQSTFKRLTSRLHCGRVGVCRPRQVHRLHGRLDTRVEHLLSLSPQATKLRTRARGASHHPGHPCRRGREV